MPKPHRIVQCLTSGLLITGIMSCAPTRTRESVGEFTDDATLTTKVKAAIFQDSSLKVLQINVETFKGVVQLSGFVDSSENVAKAGEVARGVKGVVEVKNNLLVK